MQLQPSSRLAGLLVLDVVFLLLAAALTPEQSPILPLELSVVLVGLVAWVLARRSRAAAVTAAVLTGLFVLLTVHILVGDLGEKGPRELVPDVLLLASFSGSVVAGVLASRKSARERVPA